MLLLLMVTIALIGLRLWGETSPLYKSLSHTYVGGLIGYSIGVPAWETILYASVLCVTELYMLVASYFPNIAPTALWKLLFTPAKPKV